MTWQQSAIEHAKAEIPKEACGLVAVVSGVEKYFPCRNVSLEPEQTFTIDPDDWVIAEDAGAIIGVFHSHVSDSAKPSQTDKKFASLMSVAWHIYATETGKIETYDPPDSQVELLGREWVWRHQDCWTLVRDWYRLKGVEMPPHPPRPASIKDFVRNPFFEQELPNVGFVELPQDSDWRYGDVLLFDVGGSLSHVAIFIEDQMMLHHCIGRLSSRDNITGKELQAIAKRYRHRESVKLKRVEKV